MKIVGGAHELMLISEEGVVIRVKAERHQQARPLDAGREGHERRRDRPSVARSPACPAGKKKAKPRGIAEGQDTLLARARAGTEADGD